MDVPLATFPVLVRSGAILRRGPAHLQKTPIAISESICAHMEGRRSITLQLVEHGEAAGQGEDQRLDGPGDIKTLAGRPIRVGRDGPDEPGPETLRSTHTSYWQGRAKP